MDKSVSKGVIILVVIICPTLPKKLYASDIWSEGMSKLRNSRKV